MRFHCPDCKRSIEYLTATEAAKFLGYHKYSLHRLSSQGILKPSLKIGWAVLYSKDDLRKYKESWAYQTFKEAKRR